MQMVKKARKLLAYATATLVFFASIPIVAVTATATYSALSLFTVIFGSNRDVNAYLQHVVEAYKLTKDNYKKFFAGKTTKLPSEENKKIRAAYVTNYSQRAAVFISIPILTLAMVTLLVAVAPLAAARLVYKNVYPNPKLNTANNNNAIQARVISSNTAQRRVAVKTLTPAGNTLHISKQIRFTPIPGTKPLQNLAAQPKDKKNSNHAPTSTDLHKFNYYND